MGNHKSLGGDFAKRRGTLLFLNCKLLSANYGLYGDWFGGMLWKEGIGFAGKFYWLLLAGLAVEFATSMEFCLVDCESLAAKHGLVSTHMEARREN